MQAPWRTPCLPKQHGAVQHSSSGHPLLLISSKQQAPGALLGRTCSMLVKCPECSVIKHVRVVEAQHAALQQHPACWWTVSMQRPTMAHASSCCNSCYNYFVILQVKESELKFMHPVDAQTGSSSTLIFGLGAKASLFSLAMYVVYGALLHACNPFNAHNACLCLC